MPYADPDLVAVINPGDPIPAAWTRVVRDDVEFLIDPPVCSVFHSVDTFEVLDTTNTVLPADSTNYDNDGMHSNTTNNSRITIQTPGRYELSCNTTFEVWPEGYRRINFLINGVTAHRAFQIAASPSLETRLTASRYFALAAGDFVEISVAHSAGVTLECGLREFAATFQTR